MNIVSIDLGSNSFRVLKYDCQTDQTIAEFETAVGTADGLSQSGMISQEALQRIFVAIDMSIKKVNYDPTKAVAVTTQALRSATNSQYILDTIKEKTGIEFSIIDGTKEAQLTLLAMQYALKREKLKDDNFILLDIGGGSTELIIYANKQTKIKSFPYGIVTLAQSLTKQDDFKKFEKEILSFIQNEDISNSIFLSTAGTPTIVAAIKHDMDVNSYDKYRVNGTLLDIDEVVSIQKGLKQLSTKELEYKVGALRENFIDTGIDIFKLFFHTLEKKSSIVFDDGLKEGVAIEAGLKLK